MERHGEVTNLHTSSLLWHFLHANMLNIMRRQPLHEHFLFLGEFDDRGMLLIQRRDEFKDAIRKPLATVLGVDPVVVGLQRRYVRLVGRGHEIDELRPQTRGDCERRCGRIIDRHKLISHYGNTSATAICACGIAARIATHCRTASAALVRSIASSLLLIGCAMTANGNPGRPDTWAMTWAVCTKRSVMIAVAVIPACSADTASCRLHDEQLPQSPTAEMIASQRCMSAMTAGGAGRLASGFLKRKTCATPYCERSSSST